jgi:uncharacterized membrane protein YqhA
MAAPGAGGPLGRALWAVRYAIVVPVIVVALTAIGVIIITTAAAAHLAGQVAAAVTGDGGAGRFQPLGSVLSVLEGYLLAAILIIFAVGLYELFIARVGEAPGPARAPSALSIHSVEELKERLGRVVLLGLVVEFFRQALRLGYTSPLDLLYMAGGIVLVGAALYISAPRRHG